MDKKKKDSALEVTSVGLSTIHGKKQNHQEKERVRDHPALRDGILVEEGNPTGKSHSGQKTSQRAFFFFLKKCDVRKGVPVTTGIHLGVLFIKKRICKVGDKCAFMHTEKVEGKRRNERILW